NVAGRATLRTAQAFDLTGSAVTALHVQSVNVATPAFATLRLEAPGGHYAEFFQQGGQLSFAFDGMNQGTTPYVPATHKWWRFRELGGGLLWETSADGSAFTIR